MFELAKGNTDMTITKIFTAAAIVAATLATPVLAGNPEMPTARISYADLDLTRGSDVAKLQHRVAVALESVCGSYDNVGTIEARDIAQCRLNAAAKAKPMVTMLVDQERGTTLAQR